MSRDQKYYGHMTLSDGAHVPLTKAEAEQLMKELDAKQAEIAARWPDERSCLIAMTEAFHRLQDFGWREAIYCPKDGTPFDVIEAGSSGVHTCHYEGSWPTGSWWVADGGDLWPSHPILFRPTQKGPAR